MFAFGSFVVDIGRIVQAIDHIEQINTICTSISPFVWTLSEVDRQYIYIIHANGAFLKKKLKKTWRKNLHCNAHFLHGVLFASVFTVNLQSQLVYIIY